MKKYSEQLPLILLCLFTGKLLILNTWSFESSIVLLSLSGIVCLFHFTPKQAQLQEQKEAISNLSKEIELLKKSNENMQNHVSSLKLGASLKAPARNF